MITSATERRAFEPGTTGWTAGDLDDPAIEAQWFGGRYEIVEGVLTRMPAAYFAGGSALYKLVRAVDRCFERKRRAGNFAMDVDLIIDEARVVVADAVWLSGDEQLRQAKAAGRSGRPDLRRTRILIPPTLVIESVSPGHERHDRRTKRKWYAEFGVPNYWIVDGFEHSLECLSLKGGSYVTDVAGRRQAKLRPTAFPGLAISLGDLWKS